MSQYALDYYNRYFTDDSEIHFIVNFNYNTSTMPTSWAAARF